MVAPADLVEGREAFARRAWGTAYERLRAVGIPHLTPEDLGRLATAAYLVGDRDTTTEALERSFHRNLDAGAGLGLPQPDAGPAIRRPRQAQEIALALPGPQRQQ